jgi:hypothetical protein
MASQGPLAAGTGANNASVGTRAWSSPENITAEDGAYANCAATEETVTSNYAMATNFGFTIPAGATIDGIVVSIVRKQLRSQGTTTDSSIRLFSAGSATGDNKAAGGNWANSDETVSRGGTTDVWGATLDADTVNASAFGVGISASVNSGTDQGIEAQIDYVSMTVYYTEAPPEPTEPDAPTSLTATADGSSQIDLAWTAPAEDGGEAITGYRIQRRSPSGSGDWTTIVADTESTDTTYSDTGLDADTNYGYRVAAINSVGVGAFSTEANDTTDEAPEPEPSSSTSTNWTTQSGLGSAMGYD